MKRSTPIAAMSARRHAEFEAAGNPFPLSTFKPSAKTAKAKRPKDTGPPKPVVQLLHERSGGICEGPLCTRVAIHKHHRLNRKAGGRHGEAHERVNGVEWLLHVCYRHHELVTSSYGPRRQVARTWGWLLLEHEDAARVPVWTRHHEEPVWLLADGTWKPFEEGSA